MTFAQILAFLKSLPLTIWTWINRPAPPVAPPASPTPAPVDVHANLVEIILSETENLGPMPGTLGVIHSVNATQAASIAALIITNAKNAGVRVSLVASLIREESDFDPNAVDRNAELDTPGETAEQAAQHADLGIEQEDVSTTVGDPGFAGMTLAQIEAKLYDPTYGVSFVANTIARNIAWALAEFKADPTLASRVPNGDHLVMALNAYNTGQHGSLEIANTKGLAGSWSYGEQVVARAVKWAPLLDA